MRLGLFGGTFDPIHSAHLAVAREAADHFSLDKVLIIPNAVPPHKYRQTAASYEDRIAMVEIACAADPRFTASRLEEGKGKSYSILTIERVQRQAGSDAQLFFLIGADAFGDIETWHRWHDVVASVDFIVLSRPGYQYDIPPGARVHRLETLQMTVSSTEVRRRLAEGEAPPELPPAILAYIREHGLYRNRS